MDKSVNSSTNVNKDFKNTPHAGNTGADTKGSMNSMNDVKSAIADKAAPAIDYVKDNFSNVTDKTQDYIESAGSYIRQYPFYALLGGVALGAMIGMMISRPSTDRA